MPTTLLYIGTDKPTRADLAALPGDMTRVDTIGEARRYLLRDPDVARTSHLIAYGADIAARYTGRNPGPEVPLNPSAGGRPILLLPEPFHGSMARAAVRMGVVRIAMLPTDWSWLVDRLGMTGAERGERR